MKIKEFTTTRCLSRDDLRMLCIQQGYYTQGNNREYDRMLDKTKFEITDSVIISIAEDIYRHSDIDRIMDEYGCDEIEVMESIVFNIINASVESVKVVTV